jgi:hypothetical protein
MGFLWISFFFSFFCVFCAFLSSQMLDNIGFSFKLIFFIIFFLKKIRV